MEHEGQKESLELKNDENRNMRVDENDEMRAMRLLSEEVWDRCARHSGEYNMYLMGDGSHADRNTYIHFI